MVTKVVNTGDSSSGPMLMVIILIIAAVAGFVLYQQGAFGKHTDVSVSLPGGKSISGSIKE